MIDRHDKRRIMNITSARGCWRRRPSSAGSCSPTPRPWAWWHVLAGVLGLASTTFDNLGAADALVNDLVPEGSAGQRHRPQLHPRHQRPDHRPGHRAVGSSPPWASAGASCSSTRRRSCRCSSGCGDGRRHVPLEAPVARAKGQLRAGLRYAMSIDDPRVPLLLMAVVGTLSFNFAVLLPLLAERDHARQQT